MRIALLSVVVFFGSVIGVNAISAFTDMQDARMTRFCKSVPLGASYDDTCSKYRSSHSN